MGARRMSKGNKHKAKGTTEERRQKTMLEAGRFDVLRLVEGGIYDQGDLYLTIGGWGLTIESKNNAQLNAHSIVQKANKKANGPAVLWWKRTERKAGSQRRTQVGKPIVCMEEELFIELLEYVRSVEDPVHIR